LTATLTPTKPNSGRLGDLRTLVAACQPLVDDAFFDDACINVHSTQGSLHLSSVYCCLCSGHTPGQHETVSLAAIAARGDLCSECFAGSAFASATHRSFRRDGEYPIMVMFNLVRAAQALRAAEGYIAYHETNQRFRSPKAVTAHLAKIEVILSHQRYRMRDTGADDNPVYQSLVSAQTKLISLSCTDMVFTASQVAEVHALVLGDLTPKWYSAAPPMVDETPVFFAMAPPQSVGAGTRGTSLAFKRLSLRSDEVGVVLQCPRYVAEYLSSPGAWKASTRLRNVLTQTVAIPVDLADSTKELAAALWNPDGQNILSDFNAALEAAIKLAAQAP
jgi:hypothetical protein